LEEEANAGWFRIRGMAIKQYQSYTLTDNWFEERAPSLRGVMPDYGDRCFTTQASLDYPAQRKEGNSRPEKLAKLVRIGLLVEESCLSFACFGYAIYPFSYDSGSLILTYLMSSCLPETKPNRTLL
jgi:hypothetical protein